MNWKRLREKILEQNYPSEKEIKEAEELYSKISNYIKEEFGVETRFCGSTARKTFMKGEKDIDIFLLFDKELDNKKLEEKGLEIGEEVFKNFDAEFRKEYAEHPYTKGKIEGTEIEIVPCYKTQKGEIKSSVDRTPHHTKWCKENLTKKQREDTVILKTYLSANNLYGSSLKIRGFSGYLCEILINHYGSFKQLIEKSQNWSQKEIIDTENHYEKKIPENLQNKFKNENLVVIDPIDEERNVASVLSEENYAKFIYSSVKLEKDLGIDQFKQEKHNCTNTQIQTEIEQRGTITVIKIPSINKVNDILYPQMRKTVRRLAQIINRHDFEIYNKGFHVGENSIRIYFETNNNLPEIKEIKGPAPFHGKEHIIQFTEKYENVWVEQDRLKAKTKREKTEIKSVLQDKIERDQQKLRETGIPENVAHALEDYRFVDPVGDDQQWLNYLGEQFNIERK